MYSLYISYIFPSYVPYIFLCVFLNLWSQQEVRTCPNSDFWSNLACFGSRNGILTKFIDDSASFQPEKFKNHVILTKNFNILTKNQEKIRKYVKI